MNAAFADTYSSGSSLLTPSIAFASDPRVIEIVVLSAFAASVALLLAGVLLRLAEAVIEHRGGLNRLLKAARARAVLLRRFHERRRDRLADFDELLSEVKLVKRRRSDLARKRAEQAAAADEIIRQIGEDVEGVAGFIGIVANKYVEASARSAQQSTTLHISWARPQVVEIWAPSLSAARERLEQTYPAIFGFTVIRLMPAEYRGGGGEGRAGATDAA
ncbi:MAG: hypothetical protein GC191_16325 [Azospirillum sp.]|nr:hypothetical protein [Azospirillum sp.]